MCQAYLCYPFIAYTIRMMTLYPVFGAIPKVTVLSYWIEAVCLAHDVPTHIDCGV